MALKRTRWFLAGTLAFAVAAVCVRLGLWQLARLEARTEINASYRQALALPSLRLPGPALDSIWHDPDAFRYRRAILDGDALSEAGLIWRGRGLEGRPGVDLLTPVRVAGDTVVVVDRGWVPSPDAATADPARFPERTSAPIEGIVLPLGSHRDSGVPVEVESSNGAVLSLQRPDRGALQARLGRPIAPVYLQQLPSPSDPELPRRRSLPDLDDEGPHLGYALQWFSFAAIAVGGFLVLVARREG